MSGAHQGGICSRRQVPTHLASFFLHPWLLVLIGVQLEPGDGLNYYTKHSLSQGLGQDGAEKEPPQLPASQVLKKDPFLSDTRNRKGAGSAHGGGACSLLLCLNLNRALSKFPTRRRIVPGGRVTVIWSESGCTDPARVELWRGSRH